MTDMHFVVVITCIDGEIQDAVTTWAQRFFGAQAVDLVTEFGPEKQLRDATPAVRTIRTNVQHAVDTHRCQALALVGHSPCTGNAAPPETQQLQIRQGVDRLASWGMLSHIVGAWVDAQGQVTLIKEWKHA
jgi:hypothetical protein